MRRKQKLQVYSQSIINFNLDQDHNINEITRTEAELIEKPLNSPKQLKNKSGLLNKSVLLNKSPSGNTIGVGGGMSKSPSRNLQPYLPIREPLSGDKYNQSGVSLSNRSRYLASNARKSIAKSSNHSPEEQIFNLCVEKDISFGLLTELEKKGIDMRYIQQLVLEHMKLDVKATGFVDQNMLMREIEGKQYWSTRQKQEMMKIIENASVKGLVSFVKINHFAHAFSKLPTAYRQMNIIQSQHKQQHFRQYKTEFTDIQHQLHIIRDAIRKGQFQSHTSAFIFFDADCDSFITSNEFLTACQILNILLSHDQILDAFYFLDKQRRAYLDEEDFKNFYYDLHDFKLNVPLIIPPKQKSKNSLPQNIQKQSKGVMRQRAPSLTGNQMYQSEEDEQTPLNQIRRQSNTLQNYNSHLINKRRSPEERQQFFRNDSNVEQEINKQKQEQDLIINKYRQKIDNILNQSKKLRSVSANKTALMRQQYISKIYQQGNQSYSAINNQYKSRRIHTDQDYDANSNQQMQHLPITEQDKYAHYVKSEPRVHNQINLHDNDEILPNYNNSNNINVLEKQNNSIITVKPSLKQQYQPHNKEKLTKNTTFSKYDLEQAVDKIDSMNNSLSHIKNETQF